MNMYISRCINIILVLLAVLVLFIGISTYNLDQNSRLLDARIDNMEKTLAFLEDTVLENQKAILNSIDNLSKDQQEILSKRGEK